MKKKGFSFCINCGNVYNMCIICQLKNKSKSTFSNNYYPINFHFEIASNTDILGDFIELIKIK